MKHQLTALMDSSKRKRADIQMDALSLVPMPRITGIEGKRHRRTGSVAKSSVNVRSSSDPSFASPVTTPHKPFRMSTLRKSVKTAREKYLWALHAETAGLRSSRQQVSFDAASISPSIDRSSLSIEGRERGATLTSSDSEMPSPRRPLLSKDMLSDFDLQTTGRGRINSLASQNDLFLQRVRAFSRGEHSLEPALQSPSGRKIEFLPVVPPGSNDLLVPSDEALRFDEANGLFDLGLLFHESGQYFHRQHSTHRIREHLALARPTSPSSVRAPRYRESIRSLTTWTLAQAYLNDPELRAEVTGIPQDGNEGTTPLQERHPAVSTQENNGFQRILSLPLEAPSTLHNKADQLAISLMNSRSAFARACNRSLKQVLNPGGWLTIRPITALNLPDTFAAMSVKLRYGSTVLMSQSADARVSPKWYDESSPHHVLSSHDGFVAGKPSPRHDSHAFVNSPEEDAELNEPNTNRSKGLFRSPRENDLQIYVEPLKTSGILRLSVLGEKMQSRVELGVLQINIAAALNCCVDAGQDDGVSQQYIRWFPLMSPRDCAPVAGDMGLSTRPPESEKISDDLFSSYFAPCIKLALIWQPDPYHDQYDENLVVSVQAELGEQENLDRSIAKTYVQGYVDSISASLIDSARARELLSFCSTDIDVRYSVTKPKTRLGVAVGWIQLDHQLKAREPVCLAPTPVPHPQPTFQFLAVKDNLRSKAHIDSYEYVAAAIQEMDIRVEEVWLFEVWEFFNRIFQRREAKKRTHAVGGEKQSHHVQPVTLSERFGFSLTNDEEEGDYNELLHHIQRGINEDRATSPAMEEKKKVYIAQLLLGYVKLNLSYIKSSKAKRDSLPSAETSNIDSSGDVPGFLRRKETRNTTTTPQTRKGYDDDSFELYRRWSEGVYDEAVTNAEVKVARNLPNLISTVFPAITGAPIRLQGKTLEHVFEGGSEIVTSLRNYYVNEILRQIYKIIGSLDFVGNPTMVVSSFLTGVRDFFVQPTREFSKDPSRIGVGVAKGTLSLISHSASGIFGFASKMSATAGQAAAQLSFDDYYKQWHEEHAVSENRYKGNRKTREIVADGIIRPAEDVVVGFLFAASGVMVEPYRGFKKGRVVGFAKGVGIGTVGVVTKPLVGIFDGFAHFTEAIHDLAKDINVLEKKFQPVQKRRLPYVFGTKDLLIPFDLVSARSMQLLKKFPSRADSGPEVLVHAEVLHMEPGIDLYIVVSTKRVVLFKTRFEGSGQIVPSLLWQIVRESGVEIKSSIESRGHNGIALYVTCLEQGNGVGRRLESELNMENEDVSMIRDYGSNNEVNLPPLRRRFSVNSFGVNEWDLDDDVGTEDDNHSRTNLDADRSFFVAANANVKSAAKAIVHGAGALVPLQNHFSPLARGSSSNRGRFSTNAWSLVNSTTGKR